MEDCATEGVYEPRPVRVLIVVSGCVKAKPGTAHFHIFLKRASLFLISRRAIEPDNHLVLLQIRVI